MVLVFIVSVGGQTLVSSHLHISYIYASKGTYENHSYKRPAPVMDTFLAQPYDIMTITEQYYSVCWSTRTFP